MTAESTRKKRELAFLKKLPKITRISWRDLVAAMGPLFFLSVAGIVLALHFMRPAPPSSLSIASGPVGSSYYVTAQKYRDILARSGVTLNVLPSGGSLDNLQKITGDDAEADVAFVPSGMTAGSNTEDLVSLGSMFYQPLMVFYRGESATRLSAFKGKRVSVGTPGSGTNFLALALLKGNGIEPGGVTTLMTMEAGDAMKALTTGKVDAIFLSGDSAAPGNIRQMLHTPGVRLFDFPQADAYLRRFRYLNKIDLPAGAFDLGENLPSQPISILAPTVELLARDDLHPALSDLLIEAAREVNGRATLMQNAGEFPSAVAHDIPISDDAQRYYKSGKGFAYRYLPFWLASLTDRLIVVLVPILVLLIPGLRLVPTLYAWRIKNRIYRQYGELMALERAALNPMTSEERAALLQRLDQIEMTAITVKMPGAFADQMYILRQHIKFVRARLSGEELPRNASEAADPLLPLS